MDSAPISLLQAFTESTSSEYSTASPARGRATVTDAAPVSAVEAVLEAGRRRPPPNVYRTAQQPVVPMDEDSRRPAVGALLPAISTNLLDR
ncbi:MAG: hypothetical protein H0T78_00775 [Longispora sp.]|nr:hypothetical protein [Longispora sp. (in: high G+C Gram-positive bacteria)]